MKGYILFSYIIIFMALVFPLYRIYKYGLTGYFNKRLERRQRRNQQITNLFS